MNEKRKEKERKKEREKRRGESGENRIREKMMSTKTLLRKKKVYGDVNEALIYLFFYRKGN